jgi:hypothetical protein
LSQELNLGDVNLGAPKRVRVGILSRRRKRFILNEHELVEAVLAMGFDVQVLFAPTSTLTLTHSLSGRYLQRNTSFFLSSYS